MSQFNKEDWDRLYKAVEEHEAREREFVREMQEATRNWGCIIGFVALLWVTACAACIILLVVTDKIQF